MLCQIFNFHFLFFIFYFLFFSSFYSFFLWSDVDETEMTSGFGSISYFLYSFVHL